MPGHFQRLNCEVNPEKSYSTDGSGSDENLKGVNFLHGISIWMKFPIDQSRLSIVQDFSPIFL